MKRIAIPIFIFFAGLLGIYGISALSADDVFAPPTLESIAADVALDGTEVAVDPLKIDFSHPDTFYNSKIEVAITSKDPEAVIYYTLDGSEPSKDNEKAKEYKKALTIIAGDEVSATTIKAAAEKDGEYSATAVKSYITGKEVFERFDPTTLVFVLSTDPYNLYDYYYGVSIEGYLRDEYKKSDEYHGGNIDPPAPANYNMRGRESEREMNVEVYDNTGKKLIDQPVSARVSGGWSRAENQKSWRLIARGSDSDGIPGMFKYNFFPDLVNSTGVPRAKFDRLLLRNGGNDRGQASIRDELTQALAKQAGFLDTQPARPAAIFLNGRYYGFSWLKEAYGSGYLQQEYGGQKENYQIIEKTELGESGEVFATEDYQYFFNIAAEAVENEEEKGFNNDKIFDEFCSLVDIDNLILYYTIQSFIDNRDWPNNNFKAWKYYASDGEEITNPYNDGKWRFLMYDVEFGWGLYGNGYRADTISNLLSGYNHMGGESVIMQALFQRADMREKFANTLCDLISGAFSYDNILATIGELAKESDAELNYALEKGTVSDWANPWSILMNRGQIYEFAYNRKDILNKSMRKVFEIPPETEMYKVKLHNTEGIESWLNSRHLTSDGGYAESEYYDCFPVSIKVSPYSGYEVDGFDVNGVPAEFFYVTEINGILHYELKPDASMADESKEITVTVRTKKLVGEEPLYIRELYTSGGADWVELYNPNSVTVSTKNYYLTDDPLVLNKWKFPTVSVSPESAIIVTMKNNKSANSLRKLQTNFSLKFGETIILSDMNGNIINSTEVLDMLETQSLKRFSDGSYKIVSNSREISDE